MNPITRRTFVQTSAMGMTGLSLIPNSACAQTAPPPNIVLIFCDDMGYGDMNRTGHPTIATPNLNRMADEGMMMTQFYSAASVCSPSRASLLTGRYPLRHGVIKVLFPQHQVGLPKTEITLADILKKRGYATAAIGKWHLGHRPDYLPTRRGFDYYFGIPYSNDMDSEKRGDPPIPLMRNEEIVEQPCNQDTITRRYTEEAEAFMESSAAAKRPFFVYLAHTMPHVPLHCSDTFRDNSKAGLYGDVIEEIDWSVGQILDTLKRLNLDNNTLVIFTSDNGPWLSQKTHGGSAGLFREGKATTWEGGVREPFLVRFPGKIPAGAVCAEMGTTMDLFPTCAALAGAEIPNDRPIDGQDLTPVWMGKAKSPHTSLIYHWNDKVTAIRSGSYKLHIRKFVRDSGFIECNPPELYDLEIDPSERFDCAPEHPDIVKKLLLKIAEFENELERRGENTELIQNLR